MAIQRLDRLLRNRNEETATMARIHVENLTGTQPLSEDQQKDVKGGAWYAKYDDFIRKGELQGGEIEIQSFSWGETSSR